MKTRIIYGVIRFDGSLLYEYEHSIEHLTRLFEHEKLDLRLYGAFLGLAVAGLVISLQVHGHAWIPPYLAAAITAHYANTSMRKIEDLTLRLIAAKLEQ